MFGGIFVVDGFRYHIYMLQIILKRLLSATKQNGDIFVQVYLSVSCGPEDESQHCYNE